MSLISQTFQKQLVDKGLFSKDLTLDRLFERDSFSFRADVAPPSNRAAAARQVYAELKRPMLGAEGGIDLISLFSSCPNADMRQPDTCVMDAVLAKAVRERRTVQEMLGELGGRAFVQAGSAKDQDPHCYRGAFCASNLARLRLARVIPIGWELAAEIAETSGTTMNLNGVVAAFHDDGNDGECGTGDTNESPYCGLIDPNWVFQYPEHICRLNAPTTTLIERGTAIRAQTCVDAPSCVVPKVGGIGCEEYGYCVRERRTWELGGAGCPEYAASCRTYAAKSGGLVNVLTDTVDYGTCNAGNAGCAWYAADLTAGGSNWDADGERRYFNRSVAKCEPVNAGCSELIQATVLINDDFSSGTLGVGWNADDETTVGWHADDEAPSNTIPAPTMTPVTSGGDSFLRCNGVLTGHEHCDYELDETRLAPGKTYTLSVRIRTGAAGGGVMFQLQPGGASACTINIPSGSGATWQTISTSCPVAPSATFSQSRVLLFYATGNSGQSATIDIDSIELIEGENASIASAPKTYLKIAPDSFNCYDGDPTNNHASCANSYAATCSVEDVGCERYTPTGVGATPNVTGTVSAADRCPAQCVGYSAYREVQSNFDQSADFDYFIPTAGYATQCTSAEAGCSAFTNLDFAATGGEQLSYFTEMQKCRKPSDSDANAATYYTWEGSEESGYQVREFRLMKADDESGAPHTTDNIDCGPTPGDGTYGQPEQIDCRAFYDEEGAIHYRHLSETIMVSDACTRYRLEHELDEVRCGEIDGAVSGDSCLVRGIPAMSKS
ncbi:MAG: hypothetical protein ABIG71_02485, partial [Candidatus Uhrbacteria bacterium]